MKSPPVLARLRSEYTTQGPVTQQLRLISQAPTPLAAPEPRRVTGPHDLTVLTESVLSSSKVVDEMTEVEGLIGRADPGAELAECIAPLKEEQLVLLHHYWDRVLAEEWPPAAEPLLAVDELVERQRSRVGRVTGQLSGPATAGPPGAAA